MRILYIYILYTSPKTGIYWGPGYQRCEAPVHIIPIFSHEFHPKSAMNIMNYGEKDGIHGEKPSFYRVFPHHPASSLSFRGKKRRFSAHHVRAEGRRGAPPSSRGPPPCYGLRWTRPAHDQTGSRLGEMSHPLGGEKDATNYAFYGVIQVLTMVDVYMYIYLINYKYVFVYECIEMCIHMYIYIYNIEKYTNMFIPPLKVVTCWWLAVHFNVWTTVSNSSPSLPQHISTISSK